MWSNVLASNIARLKPAGLYRIAIRKESTVLDLCA